MLSWLNAGFAGSSPDAARFWEYGGATCVLIIPVIFPPYTYLRDRRRRKQWQTGRTPRGSRPARIEMCGQRLAASVRLWTSTPRYSLTTPKASRTARCERDLRVLAHRPRLPGAPDRPGAAAPGAGKGRRPGHPPWRHRRRRGHLAVCQHPRRVPPRFCRPARIHRADDRGPEDRPAPQPRLGPRILHYGLLPRQGRNRQRDNRFRAAPARPAAPSRACCTGHPASRNG